MMLTFRPCPSVVVKNTCGIVVEHISVGAELDTMRPMDIEKRSPTETLRRGVPFLLQLLQSVYKRNVLSSTKTFE
jgi:hypothetical protein